MGMSGCASRTAEEIADERAQVLGTWEYNADGIHALQRGTLTITVRDGKLVGQIRDRWRGKINADVNLQGRHMELSLQDIRITGQIERGRFTGSVRQPTWDVSRSRVRRQSDGYFVARRVRSESVMGEATDYGCASLLRESSFRCSPLGSP